MGFLPRPLVVHRSDGLNNKRYTASRNVSAKTQHLLKFLMFWKCKHKLFMKCIEQLWGDLYLAAHIGYQDVELLKEWLQQLVQMQYSFPTVEKDARSINSDAYVSSDSISMATWLHKIAKQTMPDVLQKCSSMWVHKTHNTYKPCSINTSLTFWTSDLHFTTRVDVPSLLIALGQKVFLTIGKEETRHPEVWHRWGMVMNRAVSDVIERDFRDTSCMNTRLTEQMIQRNFEFYKKDPRVLYTDAFVCLFQPGMCEMWMPFNRTIIFIPAHRYSMGRCTKEEFERLNEHLAALASMEDPKHVIAASSVYDLEQLHHYTGLDVLPLFSYSGYYVGTNPYNPTREEIPIFIRDEKYWNDGFKNKIRKFKIVDIRELYPWYEFSDLIKHRAVIYLPYMP